MEKKSIDQKGLISGKFEYVPDERTYEVFSTIDDYTYEDTDTDLTIYVKWDA